MSSQTLSSRAQAGQGQDALANERALFAYRHFAALFIIICALFVLRRPDSLTNPQFWAEDGWLLLRGQLLHPGIAWIFEPFKGYLIVNTKLLAAFVALFPVRYAPLVYDVFAILIASLACSLFALPWYRHLVRSDLLRILACLGATAALYTESLVDNLISSQWYLALIGLLLLFKAPVLDSKRSLTVACALVACLAALTNPVLVTTAPVCLWQLMRKRNTWVAAALLAGIVVQLGFFLFYPVAITPPLPKPGVVTLAWAVLIAFVYKVVISSVFGWRTVVGISNSGSSIVFFLVSMLTAVWLVWLFVRLKSAKRLQMALALYLIAASIALPMVARSLFQGFRSPRTLEPRGEQYFFIAGCLLLFLIALSLERAVGPRWKYAQSALFGLAIAGGIYENFRVPPFYDYHWPEHAREIETWSATRNSAGALGVYVLLNPGWVLRLPPTFKDVTIAGFPDHVWARPMEGNARSVSIAPSFIRNARDFEYVDLPLVLGSRTLYEVRAIVNVDGEAVATLLVHGRLDHGTRVETSPAPVTDGSQLETEIRTDAEGQLCFHVRRLSGSHVEFRSITLFERGLPATPARAPLLNLFSARNGR